MIRSFMRTEQKYFLTPSQYLALHEALAGRMLPDAYCRDGRCYSIRNIYYDTPGNDLIRRSVEKPYYKEKLRLRAYQADAGESTPVMVELKKKIGKVVNKRRITLPLEEARQFLAGGAMPEAPDEMGRQVLRELAYFCRIHPVAPAVYLAYDREALFAADDPALRITFDRRIRTRRDRLDLAEGDDGQLLLPEGAILMEIKFSGALPLWLAQALSRLQIYRVSFSKYGTEYRRYCTGVGAGQYAPSACFPARAQPAAPAVGAPRGRPAADFD